MAPHHAVCCMAQLSNTDLGNIGIMEYCQAPTQQSWAELALLLIKRAARPTYDRMK